MLRSKVFNVKNRILAGSKGRFILHFFIVVDIILVAFKVISLRSNENVNFNIPITTLKDAKDEEGIVIVAAGDIACGPKSKNMDCKEWETSELVRVLNPDAVLVLGDLQDTDGEFEYFNGEHPFCHSSPPRCYGPTWGRFKDETFPVPGNHDYGTDGASGYFDYFNGVGKKIGRAGDRSKGYYSFDLDDWHLIALNSNCSHVGGCDIDSAQVKWLEDDLKKSKRKCTLAFWHHARFSNGTHGDDVAYADFWKVLYEANVEIVLNGHDHHYERFPRLNPDGGIYPPAGIRQFAVGTGGQNLLPINIRRQSRSHNNEVFGVLRLTLYEEWYEWQFIPIGDSNFTDSGSNLCR